jgi:uncharacterized protein YlxP (DUF503 family)
MAVGVLTLHIQLPGCNSLKEKRSRLKPLLSRLHREFNISVAEIDYHDIWHSSLLACAMVSNDSRYNQRALQAIPEWIEKNWPDITLIGQQIELM